MCLGTVAWQPLTQILQVSHSRVCTCVDSSRFTVCDCISGDGSTPIPSDVESDGDQVTIPVPVQQRETETVPRGVDPLVTALQDEGGTAPLHSPPKGLSPRPRLKRQSASMPEEDLSPKQPSQHHQHTDTPSPCSRRKSVPLQAPQTPSQSNSPAIGRKRLVFTPSSTGE